MVSTQ